MCDMDIMDSFTVQDIFIVEPCSGERGHGRHGGRGGRGRPARRVAGVGRHVHVRGEEVSGPQAMQYCPNQV